MSGPSRQTPSSIEEQLERLLPTVQKPARYVGGELNQVVKDWDRTAVRVALAFPDVYEIGLPNTALAILYDILNAEPNMLAERTYCPWTDMEEKMRANRLPLFSLESKRPIADFDMIGLSLPYETLYTNALNLLDLAGLPLRSANRDDSHPLVLAGGHATFNPEPMAPFVDAFVIGEGEEIIVEVARCIVRAKSDGVGRDALLSRLAQIWGIYVPRFFQPRYQSDGTLAAIDPVSDDGPRVVQKRIVAKLPPPVTRFLVPHMDVVHNRATIEIMRGCTRGCRFCQAGMITRPVRERPVSEIVDALASALDNTGFDEVGLLSLSSSDYDQVLDLVREVRRRFGDRRLNISLPSLRIESFSVELMELLEGSSRRSGFTLAPEAASEQMREIINKPVATEQVVKTAAEVFSRGWHTIKLYFMIGHPSESLQDVEAIADLCLAVLAEGRKALGGRAKLNVGVSTFVPKPHTPFQWSPCDTAEQVRKKQAVLRRMIGKRRGIKLSLTSPESSAVEAWLTRGDRRLAEVIYRAWSQGAKFDAWREHYDHQAWLDAFAQEDLDPDFYTYRERSIDEVLPWDHIDAAVDKKFLAEDYSWSQQGKTRVDCRDKCFACGILPKFKEIRRQHPGDGWECPEVGRAAQKAGLQPRSGAPESTNTHLPEACANTHEPPIETASACESN